MVDIFFSLFAFIIALGVLVSIHEFGHFWVARRLGVKVLVFSIGYGKPIWRYRSKSGDQTEYVIGAIPLGGYVKMLDEREGDVAEGERGKAFNRQSVWKRMAIVAAGPAANFVLAVMAYWLTYTLGVTGIKPIIGDVAVNSAAYYAGFQKEDEILVFNELRTPTWEAFRLALVDSAMETGQDVPARVKGQDGTERELFLFLEEPLLKSDGDPVTSIGLSVWRPEILPIIGGIQANGAAARA
ncbi:MAG TPA: RIP metalloprotease RseP, partial [Gammaproteobacteria bacterium]|nr:RIP metalloprotease RseP [Gammaproteobacteria bacterium]